jgi:hypothetical protein
MCHPTLTDLDYILKRWESKWSAQRHAAWQLRCSHIPAGSDSQPQPGGAGKVPMPSSKPQAPSISNVATDVQLPAGALVALQPVLDPKLCGFPLEGTIDKELSMRSGLSQNAKDSLALRASHRETSSKEVTLRE